MVKDEVDIVKDWIIYHGSMFGWNNIYIIDNNSTDGTFEVIEGFSSLITISREPDYTKKGIYMKRLIDEYSQNDIAFPIDIDEFIIYYDNNEICVDKNTIINYFNNLPPCGIYKANYITSVVTEKDGYNRAAAQTKYGIYIDMGFFAKSFINTHHYNGLIDHGNHIVCHDYHSTKIHLVHLHLRNYEQMKKKILNNVCGLGYHNDLQYLRNIIHENPQCEGSHHVISQISVLEGKYFIPITTPDERHIKLDNLCNRIIDGYF